MRDKILAQFNMLLGMLQARHSGIKTTADSKAIYEQYDDREILDYYSGSNMMLLDNQPIVMSFKREREIHLSYVFSEIDQILTRKEKATILEIGCGNCINVFEILQKYGDRVAIQGIDISENRINVAKNYFKGGLSSATLATMSITEKTPFADNQFDLVYSMFCLEQIAYDVKHALREMYRICGSRMLMLEPVFENGTLMQRIYLLHSDHTRVLLKSIHELELPLVRNEIMALQCNPANQSTVLAVDKAR